MPDGNLFVSGEEMESFAVWIKREIDRLYPTQAQFARAAGVREQLVSQWVSGKDIPTMSNITAIARGLHMDYRTVARAAGYDLPDELSRRSTDDILDELRANAPVPVPIVQHLTASAGKGERVDEYLYLPPSYRRGRAANIFGIVIQGECMVPEVQPGDYVIYDRDQQPAIDDLVVAIVDGAIYAKRLVKDGKKLALRGDADRVTIPLDEHAEIVGRVIFITRPK